MSILNRFIAGGLLAVIALAPVAGLTATTTAPAHAGGVEAKWYKTKCKDVEFVTHRYAEVCAKFGYRNQPGGGVRWESIKLYGDCSKFDDDAAFWDIFGVGWSSGMDDVSDEMWERHWVRARCGRVMDIEVPMPGRFAELTVHYDRIKLDGSYRQEWYDPADGIWFRVNACRNNKTPCRNPNN